MTDIKGILNTFALYIEHFDRGMFLKRFNFLLLLLNFRRNPQPIDMVNLGDTVNADDRQEQRRNNAVGRERDALRLHDDDLDVSSSSGDSESNHTTYVNDNGANRADGRGREATATMTTRDIE